MTELQIPKGFSEFWPLNFRLHLTFARLPCTSTVQGLPQAKIL
jgi:hypothetical protein